MTIFHSSVRVLRGLALLPLLAMVSVGVPAGVSVGVAARVEAPVAGSLQDAQAEKELVALLSRIASSQARSLEHRLALYRDLVARESDAARRASLALLESQKPVEIRALLLRHVWPLPDMEQRMLKELEGGALATREVAAGFFLERKGREGLELLLALYDEGGKPALRIGILRALGSSGKSQVQEAFATRFARLSETSRSQVLVALRGQRSRRWTAIRKDCLQAKEDALRGEALLQLVQQRDGKALALLRKLAQSRSSMVLAEHLMDALFLHSEAEDLVLAAELMGRSPGLRARLKYRIQDLLQKPGIAGWARGKGARHGSGAVRRLALDLLRAMKGEASREVLFLMTQDKRRDLRLDALIELSHRADQRILPALWGLLDKGSAEERQDALLALDRMLGDEPDYLNRLLALTRKGNSALRFLALDLASRHGLRDLLGMLPALLKSADWRLRSLGYMVAARVRDAKSIPLLIQTMKRESGRTEFECGQALRSLTRFYCRSAEDWSRWWDKQKESFVLPPPAPLEDPPAQNPGPKGKGRTQAEFYGIPVRSHRVVYVLDVSGSMNERFGTGSTRIAVARESLKTVLKKADRRSLVNVIFFDNKVRRYAKKSVPLGRKGELDKILAFVDKAKALGGTNIHGALLAALKDPRVDTVFLLSDGDPSAGEITDIQDLGSDILRRNRGRRVRIHCIAVGLESVLLKRLAKETDGRYAKY